jgi:glycosyltransferase involved in cell wall biosynthesis
MQGGGRVVFGYLGALGRVNDVGILLRAAELAEERAPGAVGLVVVGDGPERMALAHRAAPIAGVEVLPPVPKRFVPVVLRAIDAGVVHATRNPVYRYGISFNKLFEYLAASRPVAFACLSADDPVASTGAGLSIPPDDPEGLAEAMVALARMDPAERLRMGAAGRAYVEREHDIGRLAGTLAAIATAPRDGDGA